MLEDIEDVWIWRYSNIGFENSIFELDDFEVKYLIRK